MYAYKIILFFFFFNPMAFGFVDQGFFEKTQTRWYGVVKFKLNKNVQFNQDIRGPKGTLLPVAELLFTDSSFRLQKDCLVYKTPDKAKAGLIKVINIKINEKCSDYLFKESLTSIDQIFNFGLSLDKRTLLLKIDTKDFSYYLFNLIIEKGFKLNERPKEETAVPGVFVSLMDENDGELLSKGDICFDIDNSCNVIKQDVCHFCESGVIAVKSNQCHLSYRKYCSERECGEKGGFACLRGQRASSYTGHYCIVDSPLAFCKKPYRVYCENKILVCR